MYIILLRAFETVFFFFRSILVISKRGRTTIPFICHIQYLLTLPADFHLVGCEIDDILFV